MSKRKPIYSVDPKAYDGMLKLEQYLDESQLTVTHKELIKIRASQLNGCGYCLDLHTKDALAYGESARRLLVLAGWRETELFTVEEQVILALTEAVTFIHQGGISDELYQQAEQLFGATYLAQLIMCMVTINAWNRIGVATHLKAK
ncbi:MULTISPECIES: carboxymuconolactone decarboxylase family protein [Myroides]|jgi:AhpD family alkylhydroperoxidase|uniref:Carboxymuconolactone decarboxylase family protein n=1 Tax=Myroides odoratus TaxID=256 RepID=A0A9Q6Z7Y2_MYROD|nr:carboxymuconolactone decarboxylase family protein [Myroides odoratus]EHQ43557.1 alkylhydroperoxidase like protein, AhpD family [Myroides odoratus DSM 2801]EKB05892.1 alkylhydroperoxidase AhpD family core domain-containing protein [Myroides odoratus CIP 103059]QQU00882.1 carboxymuconolactone decarboxylase family protein [Myroides odoratus]WQD56870.1 carboxymuconolactone decarboxylase family protein [Myroides odoratus]STZ30834.1 Argininosuccinate synthase [Myroides odoratus]